MRLRNAMECTMLPNFVRLDNVGLRYYELGMTKVNTFFWCVSHKNGQWIACIGTPSVIPAHEEIIVSEYWSEPRILDGVRAWEFKIPPSLTSSNSLFFFGSLTTIDGHCNPIALPLITQFFHPPTSTPGRFGLRQNFWNLNLLFFGFRIV